MHESLQTGIFLETLKGNVVSSMSFIFRENLELIEEKVKGKY